MKKHFLSHRNRQNIFLLGLFFLSTTLQLQAQFISNGSFEQYSSLPNNSSQISRSIGWSSPNTATPDFYHKNSSYPVGIPHTPLGYQSTRLSSENAFGGAYFPGTTINYAEYLQYQLDNPLQAGHRYKVSFYINPANIYTGFVDKVGAYFSSTIVNVMNYATLTVTPQIVFTTGQWLDDTLNWTLLEGEFRVPTGNTYNYIILGYFNYPATLKSGEGAIENVYYFFDEINISEVLCNADAGSDITICKGESLTLPIPETSSELTWSYQILDGDNTPGTLESNVANPGETTRYILTVVDPFTCCTDQDTVTITVRNCCKCPNSCFTPGSDKVVNGNFSADFTEFLTDYTQYTDANNTPSAGNANVVSSVNGYHSGAWALNGNPGNFLYADGSSDTTDRIWSQNITGLTTGATYILCFDLNNLMNPTWGSGFSDPDVKVVINGVTMGHEVVTEAPDEWLTYSYSWVATGTTAFISLYNRNNTGSANDIGIDNITFRQCTPSAGPDVIFCEGEMTAPYILPIPDDPTLIWSYRAISGDLSSLSSANLAQPTVTTQYVLTIINPASNCGLADTVRVEIRKCCSCGEEYYAGSERISNGDFSQGNTGFTTDYELHSGSTSPGQYNVGTSVNGLNTYNGISWAGTGNPGNFLYVDGDSNYQNNKKVWAQTVTSVLEGTTYKLCMQVNNLRPPGANDSLPELQIRINGVPLTPTITIPESPDTWVDVSFSWIVPSGITTAVITIVDLDTNVYGNDFGIDNISFRSCTPKFTANAGSNQTICKGSSVNLPFPSEEEYEWSYQVISEGAPYLISGHTPSPERTSTYVLTVIYPAMQDTARDTVMVTVECCFCPQGQAGSDLITNGNFSGGVSGFTSLYTPGGAAAQGYYWVLPSSSTVSSNWDKTGNSGKFLFADGSASASDYVWSQTVSVQQNKNYSLCLDMINLKAAPGYPAGNDPIVAVYINGMFVVADTVDEYHTWTPLSASWNSGVNVSATIRIYSLNTGSTGNDFGIDNIKFTPCDPQPPGIQDPGTTGGKPQQDPLAAAHGTLQVFPNPGTNEVYVRFPKEMNDLQKLLFIDMSGRTVKTIQVQLNGNREISIPVSDLKKGLYTIAAYNRKGCTGKKLFIKE